MSANGKKPYNGMKLRGLRQHRSIGKLAGESRGSQPATLSGNEGVRAMHGMEGGQGFGPDGAGRACQAISSGAGEGRDTETLRPSQLRCSDCADLVHELSNTMTAVLMNAQLLEWRLPPYSRLKRPVLEVERNAQRSGELLKRLLRQFGENVSLADPVTGLDWKDGTLPDQEPSGPAAATANLLPGSAVAVAPDFSTKPTELTMNCDPCTSRFFPKGDDGNER